MKIDEAEELHIEAAREGCDAGRREERGGAGKVTNKAVKTRCWHLPKFFSAYAM